MEDLEPESQKRIEQRERMVREQIERRGVRDSRVLQAMRSVPRHVFVPARLRDSAYDDTPLSIGRGQTISQPYIVAVMCEQLALGEESRVLDIGTGSGYQASVLSEICGAVYTIEIVEVLYRRARRLLANLGNDNVYCSFGDGSVGWEDKAPFDGIVAAAATRSISESILSQLADGGVLVYPEGPPGGYQELVKIKRAGKRYTRSNLMGVRFVPMTGRASRRTRID